MTWQNTQRRRSIILKHQRVMIHVQYHKGQQQTGRGKDNIRFVAQPIADLLLDYLVYVRPLYEVFVYSQGLAATLSPFLWSKRGEVWPDVQLSRCLEKASARAQIPRLHVANWRQMTVAIVKTKFVSHLAYFDLADEETDEEENEETIRTLT